MCNVINGTGKLWSISGRPKAWDVSAAQNFKVILITIQMRKSNVNIKLSKQRTLEDTT